MRSLSVKPFAWSAALLVGALMVNTAYSTIDLARAHTAARAVLSPNPAAQQNLWNEHQVNLSSQQNAQAHGLELAPSWLLGLDGDYVHQGVTTDGKPFVLSYSFLDGNAIEKNFQIGSSTLSATAQYSAREGVITINEVNGDKIVFPRALEKFEREGALLISVDSGLQFQKREQSAALTQTFE